MATITRKEVTAKPVITHILELSERDTQVVSLALRRYVDGDSCKDTRGQVTARNDAQLLWDAVTDSLIEVGAAWHSGRIENPEAEEDDIAADINGGL